jgi:hypothetical protein
VVADLVFRRSPEIDPKPYALGRFAGRYT